MHRYERTAGGEYCKALYIVTAICVTMHMSRIYNVSSLINQPLLSVHRETVYEKGNCIWKGNLVYKTNKISTSYTHHNMFTR